MKWRFQWIYRLGLAVCVVGAFWAVLASAQTNEAASAVGAGGATNEVGSLVNKLGSLEKQLEEHDLIFHLDKVGALQKPLFGQPLWKYIAALV